MQESLQSRIIYRFFFFSLYIFVQNVVVNCKSLLVGFNKSKDELVFFSLYQERHIIPVKHLILTVNLWTSGGARESPR